MLTVGMYGNGNVGTAGCNDKDYRSQFSLWCMYSAPLMLGCDIRKMNEQTLKLVTNKDLIRINQDLEARPPVATHHPWSDKLVAMMKHLDDGTYAIGMFNMGEHDGEVCMTFSDFGLPAHAGYDVVVRDILDGEGEETYREYMRKRVEAHDCKMYIARLVKR